MAVENSRISGKPQYYTILDDSASHTDINTALVDYDVVYLEPGNYVSVTGVVTIPQNKQLIGLTNAVSTNDPVDLTGFAAASYISMAVDSHLSNIKITLLAAATTPGAVRSTGFVTVENVFVYSHGNAKYAFYGFFREIKRCIVQNMRGCYLSGVVAGQNGFPVIRDSSFEGTGASDATAFGIVMLTAVDRSVIENCWFKDYYLGGIRAIGSKMKMNNLTFNNIFNGPCIQVDSGENQNHFSNIFCYWPNTTNNGDGIKLADNNDSTTITGLYCYNCGQHTLEVAVAKYLNINGVYSYEGGDAAHSPFEFTTVTNSILNNLCSYGSAGYGAKLDSCDDNQITGVNMQDAADSGIYVTGSDRNCFSGVTIQNCVDGIEVIAGQTGLQFSGMLVTGNSATGFLAG